MPTGNGNGRIPIELLPPEQRPPRAAVIRPRVPRPFHRGRSLAIALALFFLTIISTLAAGVDFAISYSQNRSPSFDDFLGAYALAYHDPRVLLSGIPFAATLLGILMVHELGHWFACRHYGIVASYPYFIPFPTLFGTIGAFIRIRSPIINRKSLFDVGLSGPVVGFLIAFPAMAIAILYSKIVPGAASNSDFAFGEPLAMRLLKALIRPRVYGTDLLLNPIGRAAWVGLFATSLNLLPAGQLDGGHILYSLASGAHRRASRLVPLALIPLCYFSQIWILWIILLLTIGYRHPPLMDRWEPLDMKRRIWAGVGLAIFVLSFMPVPIITRVLWWRPIYDLFR